MSQQPNDGKAQHALVDGGCSMYLRSESSHTGKDDDLNLLAILRILWASKWVVGGITTLITVAALIYALTAKHWYTAEVVVLPTASDSLESGISGQFGGLAGLAGLAGISLGKANPTEPLAVLTSRDFLGSFVQDHGLMPSLLADKWDAKTKHWKSTDPRRAPDIRDAIKLFEEDVLRVREDKKTGIISVSIKWTDPEVAANWANLLVSDLNARMRQRALLEAEANLSYLKKELNSAEIVTMQQSIGRLLESELQKVMLARGKKEFAFRVVDPATVPKWRSSPKRIQIVGLGAIIGGMLSVLIVFFRHSIREDDATEAQLSSSAPSQYHSQQASNN